MLICFSFHKIDYQYVLFGFVIGAGNPRLFHLGLYAAAMDLDDVIGMLLVMMMCILILFVIARSVSW